jgi:hypothetical protein
MRTQEQVFGGHALTGFKQFSMSFIFSLAELLTIFSLPKVEKLLRKLSKAIFLKINAGNHARR